MTGWRYKILSSYIQPLIAGLLIAFSLPPWGWWPLLFLGLLYWMYLIYGLGGDVLDEQNSDGKLKLWGLECWSRFKISLLVAVGWFLPSLLWIADLSVPGYLIAVLFFGLLFGVGTALLIPPSSSASFFSSDLRSTSREISSVLLRTAYFIFCITAFSAMLVLVEHIRSRWPFGGVPLSTLAMALVGSPISSTARFLSSLFTVFLVGLFVMGVFAIFKRREQIGALVILVAILASVLSAVFAPTTSPTGEDLQIAIVQGGGPQRVRAGNANSTEVFRRHLTASQNITSPVDLVVWPENVVDVTTFTGSSKEAQIAQLAEELDAYIYVGVVEDVDEDTFANYSVLISPAGEQVDIYEKVRRVPFGEFVPFRSIAEPFAPSFLPQREARVGTGEPIITDGEHIFGTVISWEVFFEDRVRHAARSDAELIINPTNNSSYWLGIVQSQQIASSKLRALETGLWVVQVAPTGFSAFVDPSGNVTAKTSIGRQEVIRMSVELRDGETLSTKLGTWPMVGLSLVLVLVGWGLYFSRYLRFRGSFRDDEV